MTAVDVTPVEKPAVDTKRAWTKGRVVGVLSLALYALIAFFLVRMIIVNYDPEFIARYLPRMLGGLWITIKLCTLAIVLGALIAFPSLLRNCGPSIIFSSAARNAATSPSGVNRPVSP